MPAMHRVGLRALSWLSVLALVACGGDDEHGTIDAPGAIDAPGGDVDAPVDAPMPGTVTVTVRAMGNPVPGVDVVWTDPSGAVITHEATNSVGVATEDVYAGSAVTIAAVGPNNTFTGTYLAIEPGDSLVWTFDPPARVRHGDLTVTLPTVQAPVTATHIVASIGCDQFQVASNATQVTGVIRTDCLGSDQNIDLVVTAVSATGVIVGYVVRTDVATVANGNTSVNLANATWATTTDPLAVTLSNVPTARNLGFEQHFRSDGIDFRGFDVAGTPTAANVTMQSAYFQGGIVDRLQYALFIARGTNQAPEGVSVLLVGKPDHPAAVSHDLSTLLPTITAATAANNSGRLRLGWTSAGSFSSADGALFIANWMEGATAHQAYVMAPPGIAQPFDLPALPDALASYRPTATSVFAQPTVIFAEADFLANYRAFRPVGWTLFGARATDGLPATGGVIRATLGGTIPN